MKNWIIAFALLFALCVTAFLLVRVLAPSGHVAVIRIDGEVYKKIDLDTVATAYDMEIDNEFGYNKIHIENGGISVTEADCRDGICVAQGEIHEDGVPIVCMPHHLTIEIEGDDIDG